MSTKLGAGVVSILLVCLVLQAYNSNNLSVQNDKLLKSSIVQRQLAASVEREWAFMAVTHVHQLRQLDEMFLGDKHPFESGQLRILLDGMDKNITEMTSKIPGKE